MFISCYILCGVRHKEMFQALKWTEDGELSSIDMARILDALNNEKLVECKTEEHEPASIGDLRKD